MGDAKATSTPSLNFIATDMTLSIRDAASTPFTTTTQQRLTAFLSNGFTSDEQVSADPASTGFIALRFGGTKVQIVEVDSPTSTGDVTPSANYPVGAILILGSQSDAFSAKSDSQAGGWCFGFASRNEQFSHGIHEEDAAATMNNGSISDDVALNVLLHDGSTGLVASASLGQTSFTLSFTSVLGSARKQVVLLVPQADFTATGAGSFPLATAAGTGSLTFQGTGAGSFPLAQGAGTASLTFQAAGAGAFALPLGSGTASLTFQASGAGDFPLATGEGVGQSGFTATGPGVFPLPIGDGLALLVFQATGVGFFPLATAQGFGPEGPTLACESAMEGDFKTTSALLANYSVVKALSGDYSTITDLEGDNC